MVSREQEEVLYGWIIRMTWSVFDGGYGLKVERKAETKLKEALVHFKYNFKGLKLRVLKST